MRCLRSFHLLLVLALGLLVLSLLRPLTETDPALQHEGIYRVQPEARALDALSSPR